MHINLKRVTLVSFVQQITSSILKLAWYKNREMQIPESPSPTRSPLPMSAQSVDISIAHMAEKGARTAQSV